MTKLFEVQQSIFSRLSNYAALNQSANGVFDFVPEQTKFPYVVLGRVYYTPENTKTTKGARIEVTIDVWSASKGKKETYDIVEVIGESLEDELVIPGVDVIDQEIKSIEVLEEVNDLYHGTVIFEVLIDLEG